MQRIERYGVVALVFFLVTIAAVSLWDDGVPEQVPGTAKAKQRLAQNKKSQLPAFKGPQSRTLPVTARKNASRPLKRAASRNRNAPGKRTARNTGQAKFSALPSTVVAKAPVIKEDSEVVFPESMTVPDPRTQGRAERQTTNYDTVASREQALAQAAQNKRKRASAKRPAKQEAPAAPTQSAGTYRVMKDDTLSGIASRTLGSSKRWREIQALNGNLDPSALKEGTVLLLPGGAAVAQAAPAVNRPRAARGAGSSAGGYVVRKGDVLSRIAQNELGGASRWREIAALNPGIDPNRIKEGDYLRMPGSSTVLASLTSERKPAKKKNRVR